MNQQFTVGTFTNPSRLIMITFFIKNGSLNNRYRRLDVLEFIYRTYIDNPEVASRNSNIMIRNIGKYGLSDISGVLEEALYEWKADAPNDILSYDSKWIYLDVDITEQGLVSSIKTVINMLYKKYFKCDILFPQELSYDILSKDTNLDEFGKSVYRNRVLEDMQYCPLCEETLLSNLFAVHIVPSNKCKDSEDLSTKDNGILMCREHAEAYLSGEFSFNDLGFVCNCSSSVANEKMHLSFAIRSSGRKKYLSRLNNLVGEGEG